MIRLASSGVQRNRLSLACCTSFRCSAKSSCLRLNGLSRPLSTSCDPDTKTGLDERTVFADYSRRGILDCIGIHLPNICIRPGAPNKAASDFFSSILREPLAGQEAVLPVGEDVRTWHASPRSAVGFLTHAASIDLAPLGGRRSLMMPGVSASVGEQIEALRRVAGEAAVRLIRREPDATLNPMFRTIPGRFDTNRVAAPGFQA
jgi:nucleoside-diphosphate-sugar epimerase